MRQLFFMYLFSTLSDEAVAKALSDKGYIQIAYPPYKILNGEFHHNGGSYYSDRASRMTTLDDVHPLSNLKFFPALVNVYPITPKAVGLWRKNSFVFFYVVDWEDDSPCYYARYPHPLCNL